MGVCSGDEGKPINLIFECGNRRNEVVTSDGRELRKPLKMFSKLSGIPESKIVDVQYKYKSLDLNSTIFFVVDFDIIKTLNFCTLSNSS